MIQNQTKPFHSMGTFFLLLLLSVAVGPLSGHTGGWADLVPAARNEEKADVAIDLDSFDTESIDDDSVGYEDSNADNPEEMYDEVYIPITYEDGAEADALRDFYDYQEPIPARIYWALQRMVRKYPDNINAQDALAMVQNIYEYWGGDLERCLTAVIDDPNFIGLSSSIRMLLEHHHIRVAGDDKSQEILGR